MTYSYDPTKINERSVSRVRFELGDTLVDGKEATCMLCDEEIDAIINANPNWKVALFKLADAVCMRLSYETDWKDDGAAFSLNQRAERWKELRERFRKDAAAGSTVPTCGAVDDSLANPTDGGHYFRAGMMQSPNVQPPSPYDRGDA